MRLIIFGATGQLGKCFLLRLSQMSQAGFSEMDKSGISGFKQSPRAVDISNCEMVRAAVASYQPDWIVNAAAFTKVDAAETDPIQAISTNAGGAANVALCAREVGARLIYFSTESVFDGTSNVPYSENDTRNPLSVYSISKQAGEDLTRELCEDSYVIRTSWLYGDSTTSNFPARLIANLSASQEPVPVVTDLVGNPTPVELLVKATLALIQSPPEAGTYHICTTGSATKNEWARAIARTHGFSPERILPAHSMDFATPARRSQHVILSCEKFLSTGLMELPHWTDYYPD